MSHPIPAPEWIESIKQIALDAAKLIATIYDHQLPLNIKTKSDNSPLTCADIQADVQIRAKIKALTPNIPIVTEETQGDLQFPQPPDTLFWLVDPLDGTKEFIHRTGEFTVNIALIWQHQPILGVVALPLTQTCYWAEKGKGAYFQEATGKIARLTVDTTHKNWLTVAISRSHCTEPQYKRFIERLQRWTKEVRLLKAGSALKICLVAHGLADIYPRFGPTQGWDTAAGDLVLTEAGGSLIDLAGNPLRYGQKNNLKNPAFMATTPLYISKILAL